MKKFVFIIFIILSIYSFADNYEQYRKYELNRSSDRNLKVEMVVSDIIFNYSAKNRIEIYYKNKTPEFPNINLNKYVNNTTISEDFIDTYKTFSLFKRLALGKDTYVKNWEGAGVYSFLLNYSLEDIILINNKGLISLNNITVNKSIRAITSLGNTQVKNLSTKNFYIENGLGKIDLKNIFVKEKTHIKNDSGNISISNHDNPINNLEIDSNSSLISLQDIIAKKINIKNDEGRVDVIIKQIDDLNIKMKAGNVFIKVYGQNFNLDLKTKDGTIRVFGEEKESEYKRNNETYENNIKVHVENGNIHVYDVSYLN
ncbi:MAG: DUF4097 family beta strand repeat-containing protein [Thermotogota bacterium]